MGGCQLEENPDGDINVVSIDDMDIENVAFVKIDTEGFEKNVLLGMKKTINLYHPSFLIEIWDENYDDVNNILVSLGYTGEKYRRSNDYIYTWDSKEDMNNGDT